MAALGNFAVKILLRDDIWARITDPGFREASHITRSITITWNAPALLHLVIRRALHNEALRNFYQVDPNLVLGSTEEQKKLFYRIFPAQVDTGARKSTTLDWMLTRTADGNPPNSTTRVDSLTDGGTRSTTKIIGDGSTRPAG